MPIDASYEACSLLLHLRDRGFTVSAAGSAGLVVSPKGEITPDLRAQIAPHARELARLVSDQQYFRKTLKGLREREEAVEAWMWDYLHRNLWPAPEEKNPFDVEIVTLCDGSKPTAISSRQLDAVATTLREHNAHAAEREAAKNHEQTPATAAANQQQKSKSKKGRKVSDQDQEPAIGGLFS